MKISTFNIIAAGKKSVDILCFIGNSTFHLSAIIASIAIGQALAWPGSSSSSESMSVESIETPSIESTSVEEASMEMNSTDNSNSTATTVEEPGFFARLFRGKREATELEVDTRTLEVAGKRACLKIIDDIHN